MSISLGITVALTVGVTVAVVVHGSTVGAQSAPAPTPTSAGAAFAPVTPCRLLDTRQGAGQASAAGSTTRLNVSGRCGVVAGGTAASLTITAIAAVGSGFVTAFPAGTQRPEASNVNVDSGTTIANSAVVALSADGAIDLYVSASVHLVVDVAGVFVPVDAAVSAGRFRATAPSRLLDTRATRSRGTDDLVIPLPPGVPSYVSALAISVTIVDASQPAYLTVHPVGTPRPTASIVNTDDLHPTRAVTVLTPVSSGGLIVHRSATTDVLVDISGWFTGPGTEPGTDGLFVSEAPRRAWDSRSTNDPIHANGTVERQLLTAQMLAAFPAAAVVMNVTAIDSTAPGFVSAFPAGTTRPEVSMLNVSWRRPIASMTVVGTSDRGVSFFASVGAHISVDVAGAFTGSPAAATTPVPSNAAPTFGGRVLFVSDSSLAGIRWNGALGSLQGASFVADLESCRRLIGSSCRGREGYTPSTAVSAILYARGQFDTLVVGAGYNDYSSTFPAAFDAVVGAARARGISRIVWIDYREAVIYSSPQQASNAETFAANNRTLRSRVASGRYPEVHIADWNGYTAQHADWLTVDGVHVTDTGARAAAEYISRTLAYLERRPCPAAIGGPSAPGGWCAQPDVVGAP
jgi:hypothetical protein